MVRYASQNAIVEWSYISGRPYADPFNQVVLDVQFTDPQGNEHLVPAFWSGDQTWRVRYASSTIGLHRYRTVCSDADNADLHGREGVLEVLPYDGANPLLEHGRLRVAADRRHLEHIDGTPFFWLGDTWWMSLCRRLSWPEGFRELTADRIAKGFTVVQVVAGLYPDMEPFDERGANEAGFPWDGRFTRVNPAYGDLPWEDAYRLPGSGQLGLGKGLLERYSWLRFVPHPEWVEPHQSAERRVSVYAAGIPERVRVFYIPAQEVWTLWRGQMTVRELETGLTYRGFFFDPKTGREHEIGPVRGDEQGTYLLPKPPIFQDWVVVLER